MKLLYTERQGLTKPRVKETLEPETAKGLLGLIEARISENWFGDRFPFECQDGGSNAGCDEEKLKNGLMAYDLIWPADWSAPEHFN